MIDKKSLDGVQLFAENKAADFFKFYDVLGSGIPRFILLDKEGNIINAKAQQPSMRTLEDVLEKLE